MYWCNSIPRCCWWSRLLSGALLAVKPQYTPPRPALKQPVESSLSPDRQIRLSHRLLRAEPVPAGDDRRDRGHAHAAAQTVDSSTHVCVARAQRSDLPAPRALLICVTAAREARAIGGQAANIRVESDGRRVPAATVRQRRAQRRCSSIEQALNRPIRRRIEACGPPRSRPRAPPRPWTR